VPDKPIVKMMTRGSYPRLIEGGVEIYEYTPGFLHSKVLVADDAYAVVGTINLDYRSLVHHFEDAVWIYNSPVVEDIRDDFLKTLEVSLNMKEAESKLGLPARLVRSFVKLFAPLL
jgi:cardiolipin synthase